MVGSSGAVAGGSSGADEGRAADRASDVRVPYGCRSENVQRTSTTIITTTTTIRANAAANAIKEGMRRSAATTSC